MEGGNCVKNEPGIGGYDPELRLEAYRFRRAFPKHFHEYYVIGCVEDGRGSLVCNGVEHLLEPGSVMICNPGDLHACAESGAALDFRSLHIPRETMLDLAEGAAGRRALPVFSRNVVWDEEAARCCRTLHQRVMDGSQENGREEWLLLLASRLLQLCGQAAEGRAHRDAVERACAFMEGHYGERISLNQLSRLSGLSRSALLRAFTREKGATPYSYLVSLRVGAAKKLLERGVPPAEAALRTGFSDQSHFTNYFSRFIGLPPGAYRELFRESWEGSRNGRT